VSRRAWLGIVALLSFVVLLVAVFLPWPWTTFTDTSSRCGDLFHRRARFPPPSGSDVGCDILHRFAWDAAGVCIGVLVVTLTLLLAGRRRSELR
jgi:hypothetical protein